MTNLCRMGLALVQTALVALLAAMPARAADDPSIAAYAERRCLTEALYFEAGSEGEAGMRAVAEVVFRRMDAPGFPATVCKVVYQGKFRKVCQFSFVCDGARVRPRGKVLWRDAWTLAGRYLANRKAVLEEDTTQGATHFHTIDVSPGWEDEGLERTVQIGRHIFYRPKGDGARTPGARVP